MTKRRRIKGLHDIITIQHAPSTKRRLKTTEEGGSRPAGGFIKRGTVVSPRTWVFTTRPTFTRHRKPVEKSLLVEKVEEPVVNVLEETEELVVLAKMPGADRDSINCKTKDDILFICAEATDTWGTKRYEKEILLPFSVNPGSLKTSFEDKILEIKMVKGKSEKNRTRKRAKRS